MKTTFDAIRKYNLWGGNTVDLGYIRKDYLDRIKNYIGNTLVKVITGQRRTGKSYLLRQIMNFLAGTAGVSGKNILYINKEFIEFDEIVNYQDLNNFIQLYLEKIKPEGKKYLLIDEIQNIDGWEKVVNSYAQSLSGDFEIFITGSNSRLLSGELATYLSGRYMQFDVFPFGLHEFAEIHNLEINRKTFLKYIHTGGLPELFHLQEDEIKRNYLRSLKDTIILRDIIQRSKVKDPVLLEDIFNFLVMNTGNLTSVTAIVKYFKNKNKKTNYETVSSYLNLLTDTFIVHQVNRFNIRGRQLLGGERKYYLNDLAFKNYLFGVYPEDIGYNLENFIFMELKRKGYELKTGKWKDKEIDFLAVKEEKVVYFQVAYLLKDNSTIEREYGNLLNIRDNYKKYVVTLDETKFSEKNGIIHLFPWEIIEI